MSVNKWRTNRRVSRIYSNGIFVTLLQFFTGMNLRISIETMNNFISLQNTKIRNIDMEKYFEDLYGKKINLQDLEYMISKALLKETNALFLILGKEDLNIYESNITVIFEILNGLSGGMKNAFKIMFMNIDKLYKLSMILRKLPEEQRLLLFGPQISLVSNFIKMIWRKKGDMKNLEVNDFLDLTTKFFVFETWVVTSNPKVYIS